jgi:hypothetical protein
MVSAGAGAIKTFELKEISLTGEILLEVHWPHATMDLSNNGVWLMILGTFSPATV